MKTVKAIDDRIAQLEELIKQAKAKLRLNKGLFLARKNATKRRDVRFL